MDFALMGLEWKYIAEYFTANIAGVFPLGSSLFVHSHMPVQSILEKIIQVDIISSKYFTMI
jgi:hypothetical protein